MKENEPLPTELRGHPEWYGPNPSPCVGFYLDPDNAGFEPGVSKLKRWSESGPGGVPVPIAVMRLGDELLNGHSQGRPR